MFITSLNSFLTVGSSRKNRRRPVVFRLPLLPLTKPRTMRFLILVLPFVLLTHFLIAQHPWMIPVGNATDDMLYTLRIQPGDSVCVELQQPEADLLADSIQQVLVELFAFQIEQRKAGVIADPFCTKTQQPTARLRTGIAPSANAQFKISTEAQNLTTPATWSAVFFLPEVDQLPWVTDSIDVFNQVFFELPALPAEVSVLRMSGHTINGKLLTTTGSDLVLAVARKRQSLFAKNKTRLKEVSIHKSEIFSVTFAEGEWVLYAPDAIVGDDLTTDEMRIYIAGEQDARANYKPRLTTLVGTVVAGGVAFIASGGLILTLVTPLAYAGLQFAPVMHIQEQAITNPQHRFNEVYALGYERVARSRKVLGGLKGGVAGMVIGAAAYYIFVH